jgi:DNA-binding IclR family transcriptional regulator
VSLRRISASGDGGTAMVEDRAAPVLDDLATATGCRVRLGVLARQDVAYMEKRPGSTPVTEFAADATLPTATSALGRVLLAYGPGADAGLRRSLAVVRRRQMAVNPGGGHNGQCCFARPVFGWGGQIVAALGMTVADLDATLKPLIAVLTVAARSLSRELDGSHRPVHVDVARVGSR